MGKLESGIQFTGPLGNLSAYRMRGVDKIIVRRKGGASKKRIKNDPEFENTRRNNTEFSGRALGVRWLMRALLPLRRRVADHNLCGPINRMMKHVQNRDDLNEVGKRNILLSKHGSLLDGFSLNRFSTFENAIRTPLKYAIARDTLTAKVDIPELIPGLNFFPPQKHPLFSVMAVLSVVPDLYWTKDGYKFSHDKYWAWTATATTPWLHVTEGSQASTLELNLEAVPPDNNYALMLSIGICLGTPLADGIDDVEHAGCGKVLTLV